MWRGARWGSRAAPSTCTRCQIACVGDPKTATQRGLLSRARAHKFPHKCNTWYSILTFDNRASFITNICMYIYSLPWNGSCDLKYYAVCAITVIISFVIEHFVIQVLILCREMLSNCKWLQSWMDFSNIYLTFASIFFLPNFGFFV